jgi:rod shape-determining protein MreD
MINPHKARVWLYRFGFIFMCTLAFFFALVPFEIDALNWFAPDFILAFAFAWMLRRPNYAPLLIIAAALLISDFLFSRPPGLWAVISLLGVEFLRRREAFSRDMPFLAEWAMVSVLLLVMALAYRITLSVFMIEPPSLALVILQHISTLLVYPLVVLLSKFVFKVKKISATEAEQLGLTS